ncbi:hypothetical protein [Psychrobacter sp. UBA3068]|uniref:hypothetical protein n=1 Tax=Psychrobacter sp. UBA3068 TaxID=1947349 RepID=UPI00257C9EE2|nr:hypothetical protein [Psychrobacter sp. UBA3068]
MKVFKILPSAFLVFTIVLLVFIKSLFFIAIQNDFFSIGLGGGNDAEYYNDYALGYADSAVNIWPVMLRYLNDRGLYSRIITSYLLFFISLFFIPGLVNKLADLNFKEDQKNYLYIILLCLIYPTIFFYTFDVYRDVFMVFSFLVGCLVVKRCLNSSNYVNFLLLFIFSLIIGFFLLGLRPYLGYAFLLALFLWKIRFTKRRLVFLAVLYFSALFFVNYLGYLDFLTDYRSGFEEVGGASTLGLDFSNPIMFIPNFILSALGQLFGLYVTNPLAIILFLVETVPFFFMLVYVVKNIRLADNFVRFLIIFFVVYGSVWLIGNDNLGTAVRLRIYNYLAIYISFFYILRIKRLSSKRL